MACYRKVIHIGAEDSPNVRLARAELQTGKEPSYRTLVPGILGWKEFQKRTALWDEIRRTIGLDGLFYEGAQVLLLPPDWLDRAARVASDLRVALPKRIAKGIGVDPAEGTDKTAWAAVDEYGLIDVVSRHTPDTNVIPADTLAFMNKHGVNRERAGCTMFDRGGGGRQAADRLRAMGWKVNTVAFGESIIREPSRAPTRFEDRVQQREERYVYKNRRAQMYGRLRELLDPGQPKPFGIPGGFIELRRQLAPFPLLYDPEGRMFLPPKRSQNNKTGLPSLEELIGCSPDEADAVVLAVHGMDQKDTRPVVGAALGGQRG